MLFLLTLVAAVAAEECNIICHANWDPVCGSDGQTYGNGCELTSLSCLRKSGVRKLYTGECKPVKVEKLTGCQMMCNMNYEPVCGTDGVTYGNECELTSKACFAKSGVAVAFQGECQSNMAAPEEQIQHLTAVMEEQQGRMLQQQAEDESFAVFVQQADITVNQGDRIPWNVIRHNVGNGYQQNTNQFVCGETGSYFFTVSVTTTSSSHRAELEIMHEGTVVSTALAYAGSTGHGTASNSVVIMCGQGQSVWVRCSTYSSCTFKGESNKTSFVGFLI